MTSTHPEPQVRQRLYTRSVPAAPLQVRAPHFNIAGAALCDVREVDLVPLEVQDGAVRMVMTGTIATLRLLLFIPKLFASQPTSLSPSRRIACRIR